MPLHQFFSRLETLVPFTIPSCLLDRAVGPEAAAALCEARVLVPDGAATWYPCARGLRGCRRTVAVDRDDLHLICGRPSHGCAAETVPAAELGQHALDEAALVRLLQRLFGVEGQPACSEGRGQPTCLGRSPIGDGDLWLWLRPTEPAFAMWMGDLETRTHDRQRALVLVPTPERIASHTFERYGPGQPLEVVHLERALTLDEGLIVRTPPRTRLSAPLPRTLGPAVDRPSTRLRVEVGVRWSHITFEYVDDRTIAIRVGAHPPVRLSAIDLGLNHPLDGKVPALWALLLGLCAGNGTCSRSSVEVPSLNALRILATRLSERLCATFGIANSPLHVDRTTQSVTAEFLARHETRRASTRRGR